MLNVESKKQFQQATKAKKKVMTLEWCYYNFINRHDEREKNIKDKKNNEKIS